MTPFDWIVLAIVLLSTLLAFSRGVIRELIALCAWVLGLVAAIAFAPMLGALLPDIPGRYVIAFALILIAALVAGALIAWPLWRAVHAVGLGFVDRFLGSIFGFVRGIVLLLAFVFVAGLTQLPREAWWQNSAFVPPLVAGVFALRPHLPAEIAGRLDYSPDGGQRRLPMEQRHA